MFPCKDNHCSSLPNRARCYQNRAIHSSAVIINFDYLGFKSLKLVILDAYLYRFIAWLLASFKDTHPTEVQFTIASSPGDLGISQIETHFKKLG